MSKSLDSRIKNKSNDKIDKWLNAVVNEPEPSPIPKQLIEDLSDKTIKDMNKFMEYILFDNDKNKIYRQPNNIENPDDENLSFNEYKRRVINILKL